MTKYLLGAFRVGIPVVVLAACNDADSPLVADAPISPSGTSVAEAPALLAPKIVSDLSADLTVAGSRIAAGGIGLDNLPTGTIVVDIPDGAVIRTVHLYWGARGDAVNPSLVKVEVDGTSSDVLGDYIGLSDIPEGADSHSFRANLLNYPFAFDAGVNELQIMVAEGEGVDGASLVITYDDGTEGSVEMRDGNDFAYLPFAAPNRETMLQTFSFDAAEVSREATLVVIAGDVQGARPTRIALSAGGVNTDLISVLGEGGTGRNGPEWDTYSTSVTIPAGATEATAQLFSHDDGSELVAASLYWVLGAMSVPVPEIPGGGEGCTPGYWKQSHHFDSWPAPYTPDMLFADVFEDAFPGMTLVEVAGQGGGQLKALGRHSVAALLNGGSAGVSYDLTAQTVIDEFNGVFPGGAYETLKDIFAAFNEQGCPLN